MNTLRRNPLFVALFLLSFVLVQAHAMLGQVRQGYRPFTAVPVRVPFSWDMFSIPIARCDVQWDPALPVGRGYHHFRDFGAPFEWDPVYNAPGGYVYAALMGCRLRKAATRVSITCMTPRGSFQHGFDCP